MCALYHGVTGWQVVSDCVALRAHVQTSKEARVKRHKAALAAAEDDLSKCEYIPIQPRHRIGLVALSPLGLVAGSPLACRSVWRRAWAP